MVNWDDAQTNCQDISGDNSTTSLTFFKRLMNTGYKLVLSELGRPTQEKTSTSLTTSASTQYYNLPMDCLFIKSAAITVGSIKYPAVEIEDQETWDFLNQNTQTGDIPERFFVRLNYGVGHSQIGFYPIPASASNTITLVYEVIDKDLENDKYVTGTVTLTNASTTVTGSGTTFTAAMVGRYVKGNDGFYYRISAYTSATSITLEHAFEGTTTAGVTTAIHEMFHLPEELQILPVYFALAHYFASKKDTTQETKYWALFNSGLEAGKRRWGTKTRSSIIRGTKGGSRFPLWGPRHWPTSAS